ncbi:MAG: hypothetical protein MUP47_06155, partial [Phycisphaerae bacterium]|nr:hypothetical protein [Phycisphaerae bacterium]
QRDVIALRNLYAADGFLDAEVSRRLELSDDKTHAVLTFVIAQGSRYQIGRIILNGNKVFSDEDLVARLDMQSGEYFTIQGLQRDVKVLHDAYGEVGYLYAAVGASRQFPTPEGPGAAAVVNVVYDITENEPYVVGRVLVRGNTVTQDRIIRREMRFFPEQVYNTVAVEESRKRLMETRLFTKVAITPSSVSVRVTTTLVNCPVSSSRCSSALTTDSSYGAPARVLT